MQYWRNINI